MTKIKSKNFNTEKENHFISNIREYLCNNHYGKDFSNNAWSKFEEFCVTSGKDQLEISKKILHNGKVAQWWNNKTKKTVIEMKRLFKIWQRTYSDENKKNYKLAKKAARKTVAIEKDIADHNLY